MVIEGLEISAVMLLTLFALAFVAGYLDTLVGGGGLITIPALLAAGLSPLAALATNKLQAVGGSGTATVSLWLKGQFDLTEVGWLMFSAFVGSLLGTLAVQQIDAEALHFIVPSVVVVIAIYFIVMPSVDGSHRAERLTKTQYGLSAVPAIGAYDGMFGPGTGSFFVLAGSALRGQDIVRATKFAKPLNFATNAASLTVFIYYAQVLWAVGFMMMLGQFLGARLGARRLMTIDPSVLRYFVIGLCVVMLISIFW